MSFFAICVAVWSLRSFLPDSHAFTGLSLQLSPTQISSAQLTSAQLRGVWEADPTGRTQECRTEEHLAMCVAVSSLRSPVPDSHAFTGLSLQLSSAKRCMGSGSDWKNARAQERKSARAQECKSLRAQERKNARALERKTEDRRNARTEESKIDRPSCNCIPLSPWLRGRYLFSLRYVFGGR